MSQTVYVEKLRAEIDRLAVENLKFEAALHKIEDGRGGDPRAVARAALMRAALDVLGGKL